MTMMMLSGEYEPGFNVRQMDHYCDNRSRLIFEINSLRKDQ